MGVLERLKADVSFTAVSTGFLAVLISFAGPMLILYEAAEAMGAGPDMIASWVWAVSVSSGVAAIALSWWLKEPVIIAWSAPGTAMLLPLAGSISIPEAVGAYLLAGLILLCIGLSGTFDILMRRVPKGIASGMMAGILLPFGLRAFKAIQTLPSLALPMVLGFLVLKRFIPRYHLILVLVLGVLLTAASGKVSWEQVHFRATVPLLIRPQLSYQAVLSLALPLVAVSLAGQFLPGMAILHSAGFPTRSRPIIIACGLASLLCAPFGGITSVLAAITAVLCTGPAAHEDPSRRYIVGLSCGFFYILAGSFGGSATALFSALPSEFVAVLAGLALMGAITSNLVGAVFDAEHREAAVVTFLVTASGVNYAGLGAAFWGVLLGAVAFLILPAAKPSPSFEAAARKEAERGIEDEGGGAVVDVCVAGPRDVPLGELAGLGEGAASGFREGDEMVVVENDDGGVDIQVVPRSVPPAAPPQAQAGPRERHASV